MKILIVDDSGEKTRSICSVIRKKYDESEATIDSVLTIIEAKKKLALTELEVSSKKELSKMHEEGGLALLRAHRGMPRNNALVKYMSEPGVKQQLMNLYDTLINVNLDILLIMLVILLP